MSCTVRDAILPKGNGVHVNGVAIPRALIAREVQNHPARSPADAWKAAARSLVIRELLLQETRRLGLRAEPLDDGEGRRETEEEAAIRALVDREIMTPEPDAAICRRYYEQNRRSFRSPDIYEASHILFAVPASDAPAFELAKADAAAVIAALEAQPERFADFARDHSDCSSAAQGGNLGQITEGQTTPEFEQALLRLVPGEITAEPVATRYGVHVIRLDRHIAGGELPFEAVAERIAEYLAESVHRRATAQYIARLVSRATVTGIELAGSEAHRVN